MVFFLAASVLLDLTFIAATTDYWFRQHLSSGIFLLFLDALNVAAIYGAWRRMDWGYVVAILVAVFLAATAIGAVLFGGDTMGGPSQILYTIVMILLRVSIVFFAITAMLLKRSASAQ